MQLHKMQRDPFLQRRDEEKRGGLVFQGGRSYLEDLARTFGQQRLPQRNNAQFERALKFRDEEKRKINALAQENELLRESNKRFEHLAEQASKALSLKSALNSKPIIDYERPTTCSSGCTSTGRENVVSSTNKKHTTEYVPGEILRSVIPNSRGQTSEHFNEGRQADDKGVSEPAAAGSVSPK